MRFERIYEIFLLIFVFIAIVKGSCLEYGHSCWGAHGKRSSGKLLHEPIKLANSKLDASVDSNVDRHKILMDYPDDIINSMENEQHTQISTEADTRGDYRGSAAKIKMLGEKLNEQQRQLDELVPADRWKQIPLFKLNKFSRFPLNQNAMDDSLIVQRRKQSDKLPTQPDLTYYDFK